MVPVNVFDAAVTVISAEPSKATPLIFFVAVSLLAVLAVPDNVPIKFVEVTLVNPATEVNVPPADILVEPIVIGV